LFIDGVFSIIFAVVGLGIATGIALGVGIGAFDSYLTLTADDGRTGVDFRGRSLFKPEVLPVFEAALT